MIEVKKCDSLEGLENFGFDLYPNAVIMAAKDKEEILGAGQIIVCNGYSILGKIAVKKEYEGMMLEFSIAKSLLNMADLGGIRYIVSDMEDESLAKRLRMVKFLPENNPDAPKICQRYKYFLDLNGYFTSHCWQNIL